MVIILHRQHANAGGKESDQSGVQEAKDAREILSEGAEGLKSKRSHEPKRPGNLVLAACGCVGAFGQPHCLFLCLAPPSVLASV